VAEEKLIVLIKAKDLIEYTFCMTESTKRFPKKTRFTFVNRMQNLSLDIYSKLLKINEMPVSQRKEHQIDVLSDIKVLLFLIELTKQKGYINSKQSVIWTKRVLDVKNLTAAWMTKTK
jgi:hypothetical protein